MRYSTVGIELVLFTVLFFYGGYRLDRLIDTVPLFSIIGLFLGIGAGFYTVIRSLKSSDSTKRDVESRDKYK